jgi:hypothetical protein
LDVHAWFVLAQALLVIAAGVMGYQSFRPDQPAAKQKAPPKKEFHYVHVIHTPLPPDGGLG